jgi:hypothetical protein
MDLNISSRGGNYSAVNGFAPSRKKVKGFGNFADSNKKSVGTQKKKVGSKKRPLKYKQNLGQR